VKKIVIFASGNGTNAEQIIRFFENSNKVFVSAVYTNNPEAGVIARARKLGIPIIVFNKKMLYSTGEVLEELKKKEIDLIVLAGFLWKIPDDFITVFPQKIINLHPALLPKFGGKGMYGISVHKAVLEAGEAESGITIHWVNEYYDKGSIIFQTKIQISENENPESLAQKIHQLEHTHFPIVIEKILKKK